MMISNIKEAVKKRRREARYHGRHAAEAATALRNIERWKGKTDPRLIRAAKEYAVAVLGDRKYAPWLCVYAAMAGEFKQGWIPDNYYGFRVLPKIKGKYMEVASLRALETRLFGTAFFPNLGACVNGRYFNSAGEILNSEEMKQHLFSEAEKVVFKLDESIQGKGVFFYERENFDPESVASLGSGVFQNFIRQHDFFNSFTPHSVVTMRLTTVVDQQGGISLRAAYPRMGQPEDTHVRSATAIKVPVDVQNGSLAARGYTSDWFPVERHPGSNEAYKDKVVPHFGEGVAAVKQLHSRFPYLACIGWDAVIDEQGKVQLMEWNGGHNDIKFSEATVGPCFGDLGWA